MCPPEDPTALADRISRLLLDPELRERFGRAAQVRYEREFRVETMVEKTAALYDDVVRDAAALTPPQSWRETASGLKRAATKRMPSAPARDASSGSER